MEERSSSNIELEKGFTLGMHRRRFLQLSGLTAASLPLLAKQHGAVLIILNKTPTPLDGLADLVLTAQNEVRVYPAEPTQGYGPAFSQVRPADHPPQTQQDAQHQYADTRGDDHAERNHLAAHSTEVANQFLIQCLHDRALPDQFARRDAVVVDGHF